MKMEKGVIALFNTFTIISTLECPGSLVRSVLDY